MKRFGVFSIVLSFFLINNVFASENLYVNKVLNYSIGFPIGWGVLSNDIKEQLVPDQTINTVEIFTKNYGDNQLYINHYPDTNKRYSIYRELLDYNQNTPEKERDFTLLSNKIQTELGMKVEKLDVDNENNTVTLLCSQMSHVFGQTKELIQWRQAESTLVEFHFYIIEASEEFVNESYSILNTISSSKTDEESKMKEGSFNYDKNKDIDSKVTTDEQTKSPLWNLLMKIANPIYWTAGICLFALWTIAYFVLKRF